MAGCEWPDGREDANAEAEGKLGIATADAIPDSIAAAVPFRCAGKAAGGFSVMGRMPGGMA